MQQPFPRSAPRPAPQPRTLVLLAALLVLLVGAVLLLAAPPAAGVPAAGSERALSEALTRNFARIAGNVVAAAEEMPEESFAFKPTPEVRSFGEIVAHVADAHRRLCALVATGTTAADPGWEASTKTKADLVAVLKLSTTECEKAFAGLDDAALLRPVPFGSREVPAAAVLSFLTAHTNEHYGNLVTYLRIRGLVPPSSRK